MESVDVLLFCVVGFSILVFFVTENLGSLHQRAKTCRGVDRSGVIYDSESQGGSGYGRQGKSVGVGAEDGAEKQVLFEDFRGIGGEEGGNQVSDRESDFGSDILDVNGNTRSDVCRVNEDAGEVFDDWEGVESTELEKIFGEAVVFLSCKSNADQIDEGVKMQLYGLQKAALEGPCYGSQPMALKVSARAKWNAWQKVGKISRETAMDKYVNILAEAIPGWKGEVKGAAKDVIGSDE